MKNRWLIALSAVGIHICIGSVYAWSVLSKPIMHELGLSLQQTQWTFSIAILFLGLSAAFLGGFVEKYGPRKSGLISMFFFCGGLFGTGIAVALKSLPLLYLFYGVIGGIGLGVGYITPVSTLVKWFPERKGFATGVAIMGFGFASLIAGPVIQLIIEHYGLVPVFYILGSIYLVIMTASALYLAPPSASQAEQAVNTQREQGEITAKVQMTSKEALRTWHFYALWWIFFTNITCGIGLLSVASSMGQEVVHMTPIAAASMVGVIGLINGLGRLFWASFSDYLGRANTYLTFFAIQVFAFLLLSKTSDIFTFQLLIFLIISCYGGGFATMPSYLSDLYGTKSLSAIHGKILTAWAAAGIAGPLLVSTLRERTNSYTGILIFFAISFILSLSVMLFLKFKRPPVEEKSVGFVTSTEPLN